MGTYILLLTLTPEGRQGMLRDAESVLRASSTITTRGVQVLGLYAVLGEYDFVCILGAPSNESVARFSLELGVRADVHISTMPAIPIGRLEQRNPPTEGRRSLRSRRRLRASLSVRSPAPTAAPHLSDSRGRATLVPPRPRPLILPRQPAPRPPQPPRLPPTPLPLPLPQRPLSWAG